MADTTEELILKTRHHIVRSCYFLTLRREADAEGIEAYTKALQEKRLNTQEILDDLRKSEEYASLQSTTTMDETKNWKDMIDPNSLFYAHQEKST